MGGRLHHQSLEGHIVSVAFANGERIDSCRLVSAGRCGVQTLWLAVGDTDVFVPTHDVTEVWEAGSGARHTGGRQTGGKPGAAR
jgi:hypothetical protein